MPSQEVAALNWLDLVVLGVIVASALFAYARGLVQEVLSVGAWIGAVFATIFGFPYAQPLARELISATIIADVAAGTAIFVATLVLLALATRAISGRVKASALNALDRSLGFAFGALRGAVLVCVSYIGMNMLLTDAEQPGWVRSSKSRPAVDAGSAMLLSVVLGRSGEAKDEGKDKPSKSELHRLLSPTPKGKAPQASGAYAAEERQGLQRLIENTQ